MKTNKIKIINNILYPHFLVILILIIICTLGLIFVFRNGIKENVCPYITYALSFYTLLITILFVIKIVKKYKNNRITFKIDFVNKYVYDKLFRTRINIIGSFIFDIVYFIFNIFVGISSSSNWFIFIAFYYLVLSFLRIGISLEYRDKKRTKKFMYMFSGISLFFLNMVFMAIIIMVVNENKSYVYRGYIIYLMAFFTFYKLVLNIVNYFKFKKYNDYVLTLSKTINFLCALISIFCLQTAMITTFSADYNYKILMNSLTGIIIWLFVLVISILFIVKGKNENKYKVKATKF